MLIDLDFEVSLVASITAWVVIGFTTGFAVHRIPVRRLEHDNWLTRPRRFEDGGRFYERRLHIRSWKDKLPEKGDIFPGGFSKRTITDRSDEFLGRFAAETRRAELVHWMNAASGPLFLVWCSWPLGVVMICFGWGGHLPFVCIQRYNRSRIQRTLDRRRRPGVRRSAAPPAAAGHPAPDLPAPDQTGADQTAACAAVELPARDASRTAVDPLLPVAPLAFGTRELRSNDLPKS